MPAAITLVPPSEWSSRRKLLRAPRERSAGRSKERRARRRQSGCNHRHVRGSRGCDGGVGFLTWTHRDGAATSEDDDCKRQRDKAQCKPPKGDGSYE